MKTFQLVSFFALIASAMAFAPVDPKSELFAVVDRLNFRRGLKTTMMIPTSPCTVFTSRYDLIGLLSDAAKV